MRYNIPINVDSYNSYYCGDCCPHRSFSDKGLTEPVCLLFIERLKGNDPYFRCLSCRIVTAKYEEDKQQHTTLAVV